MEDNMENHYKKIQIKAKSIASKYKWLTKYKSNLDRARALLEIEQIKHELHCLCVEAWIAEYEEYRYWDKKRCTDGFHEQLVHFRKPISN